jgi:hypothetical protein
LLAGVATQGFASGVLPCGCDFSDVPGVVWWGSPRQMTVAELAAYAAPVFWFSPDEPSLGPARGPDIMAPEPFPFEPTTDRPVVYFQLKEIVQGPDSDEPIYRDSGGNRGEAVVDIAEGALLLLEYYAYYADELGFSAHRHDVEGAELRLAVSRSDREYLRDQGHADCGEPHLVLFVTRVTAKAHGIEWYWNVLDVDQDTRFPINLLVEEGKHATAPDKNADGYFTPSYDVNVRVNDAWGVRDIIRSGGLFTAGYQAWMTKVRHPSGRVLPPLPGDSPLHDPLARQQEEYAGGNAVYELRPLPSAAEAAAWDAAQEGKSNLEKFLINKSLPEGPEESEVGTLDQALGWVNAGVLRRSLSISAYADGRWGFSWTFPFFVGKNLNVPMTGGYVLHRMYAKGHDLRDFGWTLLYANSASRWIDSYIAAGVEWHDVTEFDVTRRRTDFVLDTGLKFRTQVGQSPLRFLSFLTEFWGLRLGVKNYGFFDIDRLTYVVEIGAGSF